MSKNTTFTVINDTLVDHTKLVKVANWTISQSKRLHALVTDTQANDEMNAPFFEMGVKISARRSAAFGTAGTCEKLVDATELRARRMV